MTKEYTPIHIDMSAEWVLGAIENNINPELLRTHSVRGLMRLTDDKYVIRLEWDVVKSMNRATRRESAVCSRCNGTGIALDTDTNMGGPCPDCTTDSADDDPTPWCTYCGARRKADCHCGSLADNE